MVEKDSLLEENGRNQPSASDSGRVFHMFSSGDSEC